MQRKIKECGRGRNAEENQRVRQRKASLVVFCIHVSSRVNERLANLDVVARSSIYQRRSLAASAHQTEQKRAFKCKPTHYTSSRLITHPGCTNTWSVTRATSPSFAAAKMSGMCSVRLATAALVKSEEQDRR